MKYDIPKIKTDINLLARALHEQRRTFKRAQHEHRDPFGLAPSDGIVAEFEAQFLDAPGRRGESGLRQFRAPRGYWMWGAVSIYFTRLCCLRASMRGRLHFSPNTRPATVENLAIEWPITLEDQREWAECIGHRYELKEEVPEVRAAG